MFNYILNTATKDQLLECLVLCDKDFYPILSSRVNLTEYADKLFKRAINFECWHKDRLAGIVSIYCEANGNTNAFITNVCVLPDYIGKGIAKDLIKRSIEYAKEAGKSEVKLEVGVSNLKVINLYSKLGFYEVEVKGNQMVMMLNI
ncbi:MAG: GNAT family N-acetyltransferase [Salinivirgaceae bacterium]|nr:GNAT family N-acetyltransferase [Salinivirgaceae bacterium]